MFDKNRQKFIHALPEDTCAVFESGVPRQRAGDQSYLFTPDRDFFYLTGLTNPHLKLLLTAAGEARLFVERPDPVRAKWTGAPLTQGEARILSGIGDVDYLDDFPGELPCRELSEQEKTRLMTGFRLVKEEFEIIQMQEAIDLTAQAMTELAGRLQPGLMEYQAEAWFNFSLLQHGVREFSFPTILAGGENSCVLHYSENDGRLLAGDLLLMDCGAERGCYCADLTRTFPVNGKFSPRQREIYDIVLEGHQRVLDAVEPGTTLLALNQVLRDFYADALTRLGLIRVKQELDEYYFHGVSHFLGLLAHDVGDKTVELQPGMVLTVEPGLYLAKEGFGIRIEDDALVTDCGGVLLSEALPREAEEVEAMVGRAL